MNKEKYQYKAESNFEFFEFYSEGPNGRIRKVVIYQKTKIENVYNLAFGDYDDNKKSIDDLSVTNNGDSLEVLTTVASTLYSFIEKHPLSQIVATGSTKARTRLYRMGITKNITGISKDFFIFGYTLEEEWKPFATGVYYEAFLIKKK